MGNDQKTGTVASRGAAAYRMTYPEKDMSYLVVDAYKDGYVEIDMNNNTISGYSIANHGGVTEFFTNWFVVVSDTPFETEMTDGSIAMVGFKTTKGQQVNLQVASSFISLEQAITNLKELKDRNIDQIAEAGRARWNEVLGRIKVEGPGMTGIRLGDLRMDGEHDMDPETLLDLCYIDCAAVAAEDGSLNIAISNRSYDRPQKEKVELPEGYSVAEVIGIQSGDVKAANTAASREVVKPAPVQAKKNTLTLSPCGMVIVKCRPVQN